ncbi:MAG: hypothetical protein BWY74_03557 [Firmicutes bacterium ADurb.Bin419]|nr:MAG: hypothetical protein BWY74_03557 [Firmicutes bacterium ADurb.Bin419]
MSGASPLVAAAVIFVQAEPQSITVGVIVTSGLLSWKVLHTVSKSWSGAALLGINQKSMLPFTVVVVSAGSDVLSPAGGVVVFGSSFSLHATKLKDNDEINKNAITFLSIIFFSPFNDN